MELSPEQLRHLKYQELTLHQKKLEIVKGLPHLYGWKFYKWSRAFFESRNQMNLLCASNQSSKSSTQIRKAIHWATDQSLWPKLWRTQPRQFWYLYPSKEVAAVEFDKKWVPEFMPCGDMKTHPVYGWKEEREAGKVVGVHFNSGISIYYKTYGQNAQNLQTSSCHAIFTDEELPENLYPELRFRLAATRGYFHMVFTATLGQEMWRRAMEPKDDKDELFKDAFKLNVSMYDCCQFEDGSPGMYDEAQIKQIEASCGSKTEVLRRVYGRFVREEGRRFSSFDPDRHYLSDFILTKEHRIYAAVDPGGGGDSHPAGIVFVAVEPDFKRATVFKAWRGDGVVTTAGDILTKFKEMKGGLSCNGQAYDFSAKDFGTIAARSGETFSRADKSRDLGDDMINTLFRNQMLFLADDDEIRKLGGELLSLIKGQNKTSARDDLADALRYCLMMCPFDWSVLAGPAEVKTDEEIVDDRRRGNVTQQVDEIELEFEEWNSLYGEE